MEVERSKVTTFLKDLLGEDLSDVRSVTWTTDQMIVERVYFGPDGVPHPTPDGRDVLTWSEVVEYL